MANVQLSPAQIAGYAYAAGFAGSTLTTAVAIALAESSGNTWAIDNDSNGSQDQGVWQINTVHIPEFPGMVTDPNSTPGSGIAAVGASSMFNPATNAGAAYQISSGGSDFSPWSTYTSGVYQNNLSVAQGVAGAVSVTPGRGVTPAGGIGGTNPDLEGLSAYQGGSAGAVNPGLGYALVDDHDRPIISATPANRIKTVAVTAQITGLRIAGLGDVSQYVTDGTVELDADQIGQVTFTIQDSKNRMWKSLQLSTPVWYAGLRLRISDRQIGQGGGVGPAWTITAQTSIAQQMCVLRNPPVMPNGVAAGSGDDTLADSGSSTGTTSTQTSAVAGNSSSGTYDSGVVTGLPVTPVGANPLPSTMITPTDYIAYWAKKMGGQLFYGAPTYTQAVISPMPISQGVNQAVYGERLWDLCNRLAANYGFWFFDADGYNLWFGPPGSGQLTVQRNQGILLRGIPFKVGWNGSWGNRAYDAITIPQCSESTNDILTPVTVVAQLPRSRGEQVRPGMSMWLKGVPNFDANGTGQAYVVTKVSWSMDSGQTPVQVTAVTAIDPLPNDLSLLPQPQAVVPGQGNQNLPYNQQTTLSTDPTQTHLIDDFVTFALQQIGEPYIWGADSPTVGFDCSGLVEWAASQIGITFPAGGYPGTRSQSMYLECAATGNTISTQQAASLRGALLFVGYEGDEHIAISLGDNNHTLEATDPEQGVIIVANGSLEAITARFDEAATLPGADYSNHVQTAPTTINAQGGVGTSQYGPTPTKKA